MGKDKRDLKEVQKLYEAGIIKINKQGIPEIDASRLEKLPTKSEERLDPRRSIGKHKYEENTLIPPVFRPDLVSSKPESEEESINKKVNLPPRIRQQDLLNKNFEKKEFSMNEEDIPKGVGLDVGTSFLVTGRFENDGNIHFNKVRDCFLELNPKSPINKKFIKKGLDDRKAPYIEKEDSFYVLGEDAFLMANERHVNTRRPMYRGVLAPTEKEAFPILKELISRILGPPRQKNERLVFSVPGKPIDAEFDQLFHQDIIRSFITGLGYNAIPMNEAEALAYSELIEEGLTGIVISAGAGMSNVAVLSSGEPIVSFSISKSGDWIDKQAAIATNMTHSIVQQEKESPELDLMTPDPSNQIHQAISVYYGNLLVYTLEQIAYDLTRSSSLPKFKDPIPLVVGGGTSMPRGFIQKFEQALQSVDMPVAIREVRHAADPLHAVANGLCLSATME